MTWDSVQVIITGVLTVSTIIATAVVGVMFGSLKTLRDTAGDLRARVTDLEKERAEDRATIAEVEAEKKILTSMLTGKVEWVALTDQLEDHHRQALEWWQKADGHLTEIPEAIREAVLAAVAEATRIAVAEATRIAGDTA